MPEYPFELHLWEEISQRGIVIIHWHLWQWCVLLQRLKTELGIEVGLDSCFVDLRGVNLLRWLL
jgi:hypothetical protein